MSHKLKGYKMVNHNSKLQDKATRNKIYPKMARLNEIVDLFFHILVGLVLLSLHLLKIASLQAFSQNFPYSNNLFYITFPSVEVVLIFPAVKSSKMALNCNCILSKIDQSQKLVHSLSYLFGIASM